MDEAAGRRAVIYARISRDQAGNGLGVERQEALCRELAGRLGCDVTGVYADNDISAYSGRRRPQYERLLADIEGGRIDIVLCYHSDRLMRRTRELERYIDLCRPRGVVTHQVTAGVLDLSTATGLAVAKTVAAWNQHESDHKAERIKAQKQQAAAAGKYLGGRVPWGWVRDDTGAFSVDEFAGGLIHSGSEAIVSGRSLISVTRAWADAGAVSLSGKRMNTTQVRRVLLRARNAGLATFHGEVVSDSWPAIIPLPLFRQVEAVLNSPERRGQSASKFRYLLSGVALCYCGRYMTGFGVEGKRAYRCSVHQEGGRFVRGHATRKMEPLDSYVLATAAAYLGRNDVRSALVRAMQELAERSRPIQSSDVAALLSRKNALARLFAQGALSEAQLVEGTREIAVKLDDIERVASGAGGNGAMARLALAPDPVAALMDAPVDVQREALRALFVVRLNEAGPFRGSFDPSTVRIEPKGHV